MPKATGAWAVSAKRVTGTGSYSVGLYNHTRASQVALSAPILDYTIGGSAPFDFEVAEVDSLPAAGDELDTVVSPAAGTTVHAWSSYLQVNYRLADLDAPVLTVPFSATQTHISPGVSPGAQDSVTFSATLWDFSAFDWDVEVRSASGSLVATGSGTAAAQTAAAISWTWDGKDGSGAVVPDATYTARLIATDLPGNVNDAATKTVVVDTVAPVVTGFASNVARFGPNSSPNAATFSASVNEQVAWSLSIAKGAWSSTFTGSANATSPVSKVWNASPNGGDGTYTATLTSTDLAGNPTIKTASVIYDATGPTIVGFQAYNNPAFSPNGDGVKDTTSIGGSVSDPWTPISWSLAIKQGTTTIRTATGTGNADFVWDGTNALGSVVADGSYTAILTAVDAGNNATVSAPVTIIVDTLAPSIEPASIWPPAGLNTVYTSQLLSAAVADERSGLSSVLTFNLGDVTDQASASTTAYNATLSGGLMRRAGVPLTLGHQYVLEAVARDNAGNETAVEQPGPFLAITHTPTAPTAEIPVTACTVSSQINVATQTRDVTCPDVPIAVASTAVGASGTIHGEAPSYLSLDVPLAPAVLFTSIAGIEQTKPAYPAGTVSVTSLRYDLPEPTVSSFVAPVDGKTYVYGTLQSTVPATWSTASIRMAPSATTARTITCTTPSASVPCSPDALHHRYLVTLDEGVNLDATIAEHEATYAVEVLDPSESLPGYVGAVPPEVKTPLSGDEDAADLALDFDFAPDHDDMVPYWAIYDDLIPKSAYMEPDILPESPAGIQCRWADRKKTDFAGAGKNLVLVYLQPSDGIDEHWDQPRECSDGTFRASVLHRMYQNFGTWHRHALPEAGLANQRWKVKERTFTNTYTNSDSKTFTGAVFIRTDANMDREWWDCQDGREKWYSVRRVLRDHGLGTRQFNYLVILNSQMGRYPSSDVCDEDVRSEAGGRAGFNTANKPPDSRGPRAVGYVLQRVWHPVEGTEGTYTNIAFPCANVHGGAGAAHEIAHILGAVPEHNDGYTETDPTSAPFRFHMPEDVVDDLLSAWIARAFTNKTSASSAGEYAYLNHDLGSNNYRRRIVTSKDRAAYWTDGYGGNHYWYC
ncbi:MAG TPA: Ig-like domain repeat protein [Actinomycetota bacterium]